MARPIPRAPHRTASTDELLERTRRARVAVEAATAELAALTRALRESLEAEPWPN